MSTKDDGGPAFPLPCGVDHGGGYFESHTPGMSRRDYFAGQALAGICTTYRGPVDAPSLARMAYAAYGVADAMIEASKS